MSGGNGIVAREFLFVLASARRGGNTETLARHAAAALPAGVGQNWVRLMDLSLTPFEDIRHSDEGGYREPTGDLKRLLDATLQASDVVFVVPLYWYSVPASAKFYLDYWSGWMRVPGLDFKRRMAGKTLWAITVISDEDRSVADPLIDMLRLTAGYMGMGWGGALIGFGNRLGDIARDERALADAVKYFDAVER